MSAWTTKSVLKVIVVSALVIESALLAAWSIGEYRNSVEPAPPTVLPDLPEFDEALAEVAALERYLNSSSLREWANLTRSELDSGDWSRFVDRDSNGDAGRQRNTPSHRILDESERLLRDPVLLTDEILLTKYTNREWVSDALGERFPCVKHAWANSMLSIGARRRAIAVSEVKKIGDSTYEVCLRKGRVSTSKDGLIEVFPGTVLLRVVRDERGKVMVEITKQVIEAPR